MAGWQVVFHVVPRGAVAGAANAARANELGRTDWWAGAAFPADYQRRLDGVALRGQSSSATVETWGVGEGNRVDVALEQGEVRRVIVWVDVRRLDSKFGAALLDFVRRSGAVLIRHDGLIVEPTIAAYAAALRSSGAWAFANDPTEALRSYAADEDDE